MNGNTEQFAELGLDALMGLGEGDELVGPGDAMTEAVMADVRSGLAENADEA